MAFLPGWDSAETVGAVHRFAEIAGIIFLALLVLAEVVAYVYSHRQDSLRAETQLEHDAQIRSEFESREQAMLQELAQRADEHGKKVLSDAETQAKLIADAKVPVLRMVRVLSDRCAWNSDGTSVGVFIETGSLEIPTVAIAEISDWPPVASLSARSATVDERHGVAVRITFSRPRIVLGGSSGLHTEASTISTLILTVSQIGISENCCKVDPLTSSIRPL
jgi:hypothetical protein